MGSDKKTYILLILIIFIVFLTHLASFDNGHNWGDDFAAYIDQARSLAEGDYNELHAANKFRLDHSTQKGIGPVFYPWGFPLLLSPVYYLFDLDIYIMKIYVTMFFLLSLTIIYLLFRGKLNNVTCLLLVATIGFSPWFLNLKEQILSDTPFMLFSLFSLFLIDKIIVKKTIWLNKYASYFIIGLCISISFNIRSTGISLLPALFLAQFIEGRNDSKGFQGTIFDRYNFIPYLIFLLFNIIIIFKLPSGGSGYMDDLSIITPAILIKNVTYYFALPSRFFPFLHVEAYYPHFSFSKFSLIFYLAMLAFVAFGIIQRFKKDYLFIMYSFINLVILILWPHRQGFRFIISIFPIFLYFLFIGLARLEFSMNISEKLQPFKVSMAVLFGAVLLFISLVFYGHDTYKRISFNKTGFVEGPYAPDSKELFNYIKINTAENDAVIFFKPRAMHLFTGRRSLTLNRLVSLSDSLLQAPARYVAVSKKTYTPVDLTVQDLPDNLDCEFENNTFILCDLKRKHPL